MSSAYILHDLPTQNEYHIMCGLFAFQQIVKYSTHTTANSALLKPVRRHVVVVRQIK